MLYLQNIQEAQAVFVPRNGALPPGSLSFKGKSTIDLTLEIDLQVINLDLSDLYFNIAVIVPEGSPTGEYEYELKKGDDVLATGLLVVGEYAKPRQYEKPIEYEQYEAE